MNQNERNAMIEEYRHGYDLFAAVLAEIPHEAWEFKPALQEWSVHELIIHMKDSTYMGVIRLHKLIAEPGSTLMPYAEDKWSEALNYHTQEMEDALQIFRLILKTTYHLLQTLPKQVFTHSVIHPEWNEPYTFDDWFNIYISHVSDHIRQLEQIHTAWKARNR
ncbi:MAG TPA: DinB family protein [Anaerolineales bacterium]|jgi:hypothetical protein|nr:DinB family protein [Anaerolineales bacterium]